MILSVLSILDNNERVSDQEKGLTESLRAWRCRRPAGT
jgi:hypothetical protein